MPLQRPVSIFDAEFPSVDLVAEVGARCTVGKGKPSITGAATMMVQDYTTGTGANSVTKPAVIMFRDKKTKRFEHAGGGCDDVGKPPAGEAPHVTAGRETREETRNMFRFSEGTTSGMPSVRIGEYLVLYTKLKTPSGGTPIKASAFNHNYKLLEKASGVPYSWKEMDEMRRVYLDDLVAAGIDDKRPELNGNRHLATVDTGGEPIIIRNRDAKAIREVTTAVLRKLGTPGNPAAVVLNYNDNFNPTSHGGYHDKDKVWLKGTHVYYA